MYVHVQLLVQYSIIIDIIVCALRSIPCRYWATCNLGIECDIVGACNISYSLRPVSEQGVLNIGVENGYLSVRYHGKRYTIGKKKEKQVY